MVELDNIVFAFSRECFYYYYLFWIISKHGVYFLQGIYPLATKWTFPLKKHPLSCQRVFLFLFLLF